MPELLIAVAVTVVLAIIFFVWLGWSEDRRVARLRRWAAVSGWQVRPGSARPALPASWPDYPPSHGRNLITLAGERDGYPLVLEWTITDDSLQTVVYVALRRDHPTGRFRRHLFARWRSTGERYEVTGEFLPAVVAALDAVASVRFWQLSGRHLAAVHASSLEPAQIDGVIEDVVAVAAAIDAA